MTATALSSCFAPGAVYSFPARLAHVVSARSQSTILANRLGCLLLIRVRNDFIPVAFCAIVACIYPLGLPSNSNLFSTLVQPFVFGSWPRPCCRISMQNSYGFKNMNPCFRAFPVYIHIYGEGPITCWGQPGPRDKCFSV